MVGVVVAVTFPREFAAGSLFCLVLLFCFVFFFLFFSSTCFLLSGFLPHFWLRYCPVGVHPAHESSSAFVVFRGSFLSYLPVFNFTPEASSFSNRLHEYIKSDRFDQSNSARFGEYVWSTYGYRVIVVGSAEAGRTELRYRRR